MDVAGRHVLITGGSRGIGRRLAETLAAKGANLTLVARSEGPLRAVAEPIGATAIAADLSDPASLAGLVARAEQPNPVDVLVNNAGLDAVGPVADGSADDLRDLWNVNAVAVTELTRQVLPGMVDRGRGQLVFVSSLSAQVTMPGLVAYSATKAAVSQFAVGLRQELRGSGVGVTLVEIGPVDTDMFDRVALYPPCEKAFTRVRRLGLLPHSSPDTVAAGIVKAITADRKHVVVPRRAQLQTLLSHLPQQMANPVIRT